MKVNHHFTLTDAAEAVRRQTAQPFTVSWRRWRQGGLQKFLSIASTVSAAPYGYSLTKIRDDMGRKASSLIANEYAPIVHRIFEEYSQEGTSLRSIARSLNAKGIPGPKRKAWDNVTLSRILHSPLYVQATEDVYWWYLAKGLQPKQQPDACPVPAGGDRSG